MKKIVLQTESLKCGGCEAALKANLEAVSGIASAHADHLTGKVDIEFDPGEVNIERIEKIINEENLNLI